MEQVKLRLLQVSLVFIIFLFLINHFILLAAASQEALGPRKEPAGLLPGSDDRPADVLLSLWAKMLPFINNLLDKSPVHYVQFVKYDVTVSFMAQVLDTVTYLVPQVLDTAS